MVVDVNGQLQVEWQLFLNGTPYEWQTTGTDVTQVVMNEYRLCGRYHGESICYFWICKGMENLITMEVSGIQTLDDYYVHVVSLLKHLLPGKVSVSSDMNADMLLLKIKTDGNLEDLVKALKSASHLIAEGSPFHPGLEAANLFYRWKASQPVSDFWTTINFSPLN